MRTSVEEDKLFISYKGIIKQRGGFSILTTSVPFKENALFVHETLKTDTLTKRKFEAYIDQVNLLAGQHWSAKLAENLLTSEVVVALIKAGTSDSIWVRNELLFADAFGITIVPVGCGITRSAASDELSKIGVAHIQACETEHYTPGSDKEQLWADIGPSILAGIEQTRANQNAFFQATLAQREVKRPPAKPSKSIARFDHATRDGAAISIHLAGGDLTKLNGLDVIVNSENNYMQMARAIDGGSVSGALRRLGVRRHPHLDALQRELDDALDAWGAAPVPLGEVLVTSSGDPDGYLFAQLGCRFIFHVSAAEISAARGDLTPMKSPEDIRASVLHCFQKLTEVRAKDGVVSRERWQSGKTQQATTADQSHQLDNIVFPLFGSGRGGLSAAESAEVMAPQIRDTISSLDRTDLGGLNDVFVSVFLEEDLQPVLEKFINAFGAPAARDPEVFGEADQGTIP